ncbi:MAG: hypothetical protein WBM80_09110 [Woeseiaceae bacterium]
MNASYDNFAAVAVLPPVSGGRLQDQSLRNWLARSDLELVAEKQELLAQITAVLGLPYPQEGLAALRMWGQTGDRPTVWIAGADPVYLEPRLDHIRLHALSRAAMPPADLRALFNHLQTTLSDDKRFGFARLGSCGYLRSTSPIATAAVPAYVVDQLVPTDFLPQGEGSATFRNLLGEIEMSLHEHDANQRRVAAGQQPVNGLWLWGGGLAPARQTRPQPPLFSDDPLLLGYWDSANAAARLWPGSIADCIKDAPAGFVAVTPENQGDSVFLEDCLRQLRAALREKRISRLTILFRDGRRADVRRAQQLRFWRRDPRLLD